MRPRLGFTLSLLAACGIHATILLLPRAALVENAGIPTIELELNEVPAPTVLAAPPARVITRPVAARASKTTEAAVQAEAPPPAPAAAAAQPETEPAAAAPGGQAETAAVDQQASGAPSTADAGGASGAGVPGGAAAESSASGAFAPASGFASAPVPAFLPPRLLSDLPKKYPLSARRSGFEGVVRVSVLVNEMGAVIGLDVITSSGHVSLDQAALDACRQAQFAPALQDGQPVAGRVVIPVRFRLAPGPS